MKRTLLLLPLICFCQIVLSKTTYVPHYFGKITIDDGTNIVNDSSKVRDFYMEAPDGRYSITILHDSVTQERVKKIKRLKAAAGWSAASAIFSGLAVVLNPLNNARNLNRYIFSKQMMYSSTMVGLSAEMEAEELQHVDISIIIENYSDKELTVNDMNRGLIWFIPPYTDLTLTSGNPEINSLRVATNDPYNQQINYITLQTANVLREYEVDYEDKDIWFFPIMTKVIMDDDPDNGIRGYIKRNKVTMEEELYTIEEGKKLLKELKKK